MQNQELLQKLRQAASRFPFMDPASESLTECEALRVVEPLVHEVTHAVALGIRIDRGSPDRVSARFDDINMRSRTLGLVHEAHVLAIERRVLRRLGWLRHFRFDRFVEEVRLTGWSGPALPPNTLRSVMRAFGRDESMDVMVHRTVVALERLAEEGGSDADAEVH